MLAPICLFTYNRLEETKQAVEALQDNFLAPESDLFIFSDGPKNKDSIVKVESVRSYIKTIENGFKSIELIESIENKGLATSIIEGVTEILSRYENVIVLEDDLITAPNFLDFMNQGLNFYHGDESIISISGYTLELPSLPGVNDYYYGYRASSWGWGIWENRWRALDWEVSDYHEFKKNKTLKRRFNRGGSDMTKMLKNQMEGRIDSWAIRFCYHQFRNDLKTVFPTVSKLESIGFGKDATHTTGVSRFLTTLDKSNKRNFVFNSYDGINELLATEFMNKFSIYARLMDKVKQKF